jgi:acyl carrier protein
MTNDFERLKAVLVEHGAPESAITRDATVASLGFDALDWADIAMHVEDEFGKNLNDSYLDDGATQIELGALLEQLQTAPAAGSPLHAPAGVPDWIPEVEMWLDLATGEARPGILRRRDALRQHWASLSHEKWEDVRLGWLCDVLDEALSHVKNDVWGVRDAVESARTSITSGTLVNPATLEEARVQAWEARGSMDGLVAARAVEAAQSVMEAVEDPIATESAAEVGTWPARDAAKTGDAGYAVVAKAQEDSADRLAVALLSRLERA